jgi:hypothetical protein
MNARTLSATAPGPIPGIVCNIRATVELLTVPERGALDFSAEALQVASQEFRNAAALIDLQIMLRTKRGVAA